MTAAEFEAHLHRTIPISAQLGIRVAELNDRRVLLRAPLAANINHVKTAFGGSLYAISALACYGLFWALAADSQFFSDNLVIQEGKIQYLSPVDQDFEIEALRPDEAEIKKFFQLLKRSGKARLELTASVRVGEKVAAIFTGTYVSRLQD